METLENAVDERSARECLETVFRRLDTLARAEESKRDNFLSPILSLKMADNDLDGLAEFSRRANEHNKVAQALRWAIHDIESCLGLKETP